MRARKQLSPAERDARVFSSCLHFSALCGGVAFSLEQPGERSSQLHGAVPLEPTPVCEDDTLGRKRDKPRRGLRRLRPVQLQQGTDIGWRPSIGRADPERRGHDTRERRQVLRLDVQDEIGEKKGAAFSVKEINFPEHRSADQNLIDLARPKLRRIVAKFRIDPDACFANLRSVLETGDRPGFCRVAGALPVAKEHPVSDTRRNQVPYAAECFNRAFQVIRVLRRRVQQKVAVRQTDNAHSEGQCQAAADLDRGGLDNPNIVRGRLRMPRIEKGSCFRQRTALATADQRYLPARLLVSDCAISRCFCKVGSVSDAYEAVGSFFLLSAWYSLMSFL